MASYVELHSLFNDPSLTQRVGVACIVAADAIKAEATDTPNHANRLVWAKQVYQNPTGIGSNMLKAVLAANRTLSVADLNNATDAAIQTAVNGAVNVFADGAA